MDIFLYIAYYGNILSNGLKIVLMFLLILCCIKYLKK